MPIDNSPSYLLTYTTTDPYMAIQPAYRKSRLARNGQWLAYSIEDILTFAQEMAGHNKDIEWVPVGSSISFIKGEVYEETQDGKRSIFGHFEISDAPGMIEQIHDIN